MVERAKFRQRERRSYIPTRCITAPQPLVRGDDANVCLFMRVCLCDYECTRERIVNQFQYDLIEKFFDFIQSNLSLNAST